jgi:cyclohexyl-isocyanide hydratase
MHLLPFFGAIPVNKRVTADGNMVFAAGVTSGIDGALQVAADLRGAEAAQAIQLAIEYAPDPPFSIGTPDSARPTMLEQVPSSYRALTEQRGRLHAALVNVSELRPHGDCRCWHSRGLQSHRRRVCLLRQ